MVVASAGHCPGCEKQLVRHCSFVVGHWCQNEQLCGSHLLELTYSLRTPVCDS